MKSTRSIYFEYTGVIIIMAFLILAYGYRDSERKHGEMKKESITGAKQVEQKMPPGATCCKASFSRAKILAVEKTYTGITPANK